MAHHSERGPLFDEAFRQRFEDLIRWRRDVRRFRRDAVPEQTIDHLLYLANCAPSVGLSEPWRFVKVVGPERRKAVIDSFERCNEAARKRYSDVKADAYAQLKLSGLVEAPIHLAVFVDLATGQGHGLGRQTMPETLAYSVVSAVQTFWLAARAANLGVGWVSILDPEALRQILDIPDSWSLIAYLCVGWPEEMHLDRELDRKGWERPRDWEQKVFVR